MRRYWEALEIGLVVLLLASLSLASARLGAQEKEPGKPGEKAETAPPKMPVVKLIDAGKNPKKPLRLRVAKGTEDSVVMAIQLEVATEMDGVKLPSQRVPTQELTLETKVTGVSPAGDATYEFKVAKAEMPDAAGALDPQTAAMKSMLGAMVGLGGSAVLSSRGVLLESTIAAKEETDPMKKQMIGSLSESIQSFACPLPEEPIGIGGKWEVSSEASVSGMKIRQIAVYELVGIEGPLLELKSRLEQIGGEQDVELPGLPKGAKVRLLSLKGNAEGESHVDLSQLVARHSKANGTTESQLQLDLGLAIHQKLRQTMTMALEMKAGAAAKREKK